ncbi:MAG: arginine repressor [Lachnospiraceae bacterium]|nr:arginine repressor [Lachnospiraceae bacterium]
MKKNRHEKILKIIAENEIETQEDLAAALRESGCKVTQATVSRDIRELRLTKIQTPEGRQKYVRSSSAEHTSTDKYIRVLRDSFISMDNAQNILVIRTVSGMAMAAAAALDALHLPEVLGCIAGDDTIMAAVRTTEEARKVMDYLYGMLER